MVSSESENSDSGWEGTTSWTFGVEPLLYGVPLSVGNMLWIRWGMLKVAILVPRFLDARWTCANKLNTGWAELSKAYGVWHHSGQLVNLVAPTLYTCTRTRASSSLVDKRCAENSVKTRYSIYRKQKCGQEAMAAAWIFTATKVTHVTNVMCDVVSLSIFKSL